MRAWTLLTLLLLLGCEEHATFLAVQDLPVLEGPVRSRAAKNPVVGQIPAGQMTVKAVVIRGADYRYFRVVLADAGVGFVRAGGPTMQIYSEE